VSDNEKKLDETEFGGEEQDKPAEDSSPAPAQTSMLSMPESAMPMEQREPRPNTAHLSLGWRIVFKIGDQKKTLPMKELILVGRAVESDSTANQINFDLTPFGAYHFGVSRHHAHITLKDGYLYLEDLDSTNGTRINGFQLTANQKYRLRDGDEIEFARLRSVIQFKGPDTP
jgi:FHA domain